MVAVRRPLNGSCIDLFEDGVVEPDTVLRFAGCENGGGSSSAQGGAMYVGGNLDVRGGFVHIRDSRAYESGGSLG